MTTAAIEPKIEYLEDGVSLNFAVPFRFLSSSDLRVSRVAVGGTVTQLAEGVDWSATGGATDAGGTLTLVLTVAGAELRIRRRTARSQQIDYETNDAFPAESHEAALDRLTLISQEQDIGIDDTSARALMVPDGATAPPVADLSLPGDEGKFLQIVNGAIVPTAETDFVVPLQTAVFGHWRDDFDALLADTVLTYALETFQVVPGDIVHTLAEGFSYTVAASGATDHHLTTAGGVKLYIPLTRPVYIEQAGGGTGKTAAQNAAAMELLQAALEPVGGTILLQTGTYTAGACPNTGVYQTGGVDKLASLGTILQRPGVRIVGQDGTIWRTENIGLLAVQFVIGDGGGISGVRFEGGWVEGAANNNNCGIISLTKGDADRVNLIAPGDFATTEGWAASGDITLSAMGGRLRATYGAVGGGHIYKSFPTVIGREYRVRCQFLEGTVPDATVRAALSTTADVVDRFVVREVGFPDSTNYFTTFTFTATAATTFLHVDSTAADGDLIGDYFEIDGARVTDFPLAEQTLELRNYWIEDCEVEGFPSYGIGFQDGDIITSGLRRVTIRETGADGFDNKQRGPSALSRGLVVEDCRVTRFGLRVDGQAGIDCHGTAMVRGNWVGEFGVVGFTTIGIRLRTMAPQNVPYEATQAEGAVIDGAHIYPGPDGTTTGVQSGSPNTKITNVYGEGGTNGIVLTGNSFGSAEGSVASNCTWRDAATNNFQSQATKTTLAHCRSFNAGVAGYNNTQPFVTYIDCQDEGSALPEGHTIVPLRIGSFGESGAGSQVTQITSKATAITVATRRGRIVTHNASLGAGASVTFRVNFSGVVFPSTDLVLLQVASANYSAVANRNVTNGSFDIVLTNITAGALAEAVSINFRIFDGGTNA